MGFHLRKSCYSIPESSRCHIVIFCYKDDKNPSTCPLENKYINSNNSTSLQEPGLIRMKGTLISQ